MKRPAAFAIAFLLCATSVAAQPAPETFGETIDVRVVNVDVWVTDRDGNPVTGLTADDFEVREDGRPVELSNFFDSPPSPTPTASPSTASPPPGRGSAA